MMAIKCWCIITVPPDDACSKLPEVENGVVVYSDLNLKAGCVGRYVCNEGYTLQSIHGQKEFVCDEYGLWDFRDTSKALVKCLCKLIALLLIVLYLVTMSVYIPFFTHACLDTTQ